MARTSRRRDFIPPFDMQVEALGPGGCGTGRAPAGELVQVKPGPPGSVLHIVPMGRRDAIVHGRRLSMVQPPPDYVTPPCPAFGVCGGCALQEIPLERQRTLKVQYALNQVAAPLGLTLEQLHAQVQIHTCRGDLQPYHYRNKIELSFGHWRFVSDEQKAAGWPLEGRFMGFHAPGRFDRVADIETCLLASEGINALVKALRTLVLEASQEPLWEPRESRGFWRHALLREGQATGELLVCLFTTTPKTEGQTLDVERVMAALMKTSLPAGYVLKGVLWELNDGVADVAWGTRRALVGQDWLEERLGKISYRLSAHAFFQTNTHAAQVLYDTIGEALGRGHRVLYDLYCGTGSIGLYLHEHAELLVGVEEWAGAVLDAHANAARNGITRARYRAAKLEDALDELSGEMQGAAVVVDPPRVGLHPKAAKAIGNLRPDCLLYVACHAASLGRDAALWKSQGWELEQLWPVDLFPQTGHLELVGKFKRAD